MKQKTQKHYTDSIYYDIEQTARLMRVLTSKTFEALGIEMTLDEHAALDTISCNSGICQRDLAKIILKDRANTGRILNSLEEKNLITRFVDVKNNRLIKKMAITELGYKTLEDTNLKLRTHFKRFSDIFTKTEIEKLQENIRAFRNSLSKCVEMNI